MPRRGDTAEVYRSRVRIPIIAATMAFLTTITACGALTGQSPGSGSGDSAGSNGPLEKQKIRVGLLPVVDVAPLYQAIDKGYFKEQGLDVEPVVVSSGPEAVQNMIGGSLDIAFTSYPGAFVVQSKKIANIKIVADAYAARPGHLTLVSLADANARLKRPEDAGGKKIAVTSTGSISDLGAMSVLKTKGVRVETIEWIPMPFPEMGPAMKRGDIDGAVVAEPWVTRTEKEFGALQLLDVSSGPTTDISMTGWAALDKVTAASPNTFAAFQRGLAKGVTDVKRDRTSVLEPILVKDVKIDAATAALVHIADYPESLDAVRLQRVADLMKEFNVIPAKLDVRPMLLKSGSAK